MTLKELFLHLKKPNLVSKLRQRYHEERMVFRTVRARKTRPDTSKRIALLLDTIAGSRMTISMNRATNHRITTHANNIAEWCSWLVRITSAINHGDEEITDKCGLRDLPPKDVLISDFFTVTDTEGTLRTLDYVDVFVKVSRACVLALEQKERVDPAYLRRHSNLRALVQSVVLPIGEAIWNSRKPL